jgi:Ca2+-binding EF-hand superfamily protein
MRSTIFRSLLLLAALATTGLAACSGHGRPGPEGGAKGDASRQVPTLMFSPNGEPLNGGSLGQPSCELAMNYWLDRADADHDGRLSREEFLADARAQFAKMDLDRQGFLTSEELGRFRQPFRQGTRTGNMTDPVMSADRNLNFMVTPEEFQKQAEETFARLDAGGKGAIERSDLAATCADLAKWNETQNPNKTGGGRPGGGSPR